MKEAWQNNNSGMNYVITDTKYYNENGVNNWDCFGRKHYL